MPLLLPYSTETRKEQDRTITGSLTSRGCLGFHGERGTWLFHRNRTIGQFAGHQLVEYAINGSLYHYRVENEYKTDGKNETSTNYEIAWNNAFTAGKYTRIQLDGGNFVGPSVTTQGRTPVVLVCQPSDTATILQTEVDGHPLFPDVFNTARYVNTITSSNLISKTRIRPDYPLIGDP